MRFNRKVVKVASAVGLAGFLFQAATCNVSPDVVNSLVSAVVSQVEQSGFSFSHNLSLPGGQSYSQLIAGPGNGPHDNASDNVSN